MALEREISAERKISVDRDVYRKRYLKTETPMELLSASWGSKWKPESIRPRSEWENRDLRLNHD